MTATEMGSARPGWATSATRRRPLRAERVVVMEALLSKATKATPAVLEESQDEKATWWLFWKVGLRKGLIVSVVCVSVRARREHPTSFPQVRKEGSLGPL